MCEIYHMAVYRSRPRVLTPSPQVGSAMTDGVIISRISRSFFLFSFFPFAFDIRSSLLFAFFILSAFFSVITTLVPLLSFIFFVLILVLQSFGWTLCSRIMCCCRKPNCLNTFVHWGQPALSLAAFFHLSSRSILKPDCFLRCRIDNV